MWGTMPEILKIGHLLKTDKDGFIVSESSVDKITPPWKESVEEITNIYLQHLDNNVHSIYVRGTVSRGDAIQGVSDIDTFAVILQKKEDIDRSWVQKTRTLLEHKFSFVSGIEIDFVSYNELFDGDALFNYRFIIKTQSVCVYGTDLAQIIQPFRADRQTARHFHRNLKVVLQKAKNGVTNSSDKENTKKWCRWVMKRIVRAGFTLVMDKEQAFTRDLYPCYEYFSKYFSEQQANMKTALNFAINPTDDATQLINFLNDFGVWMEKHIEKKFESF